MTEFIDFFYMYIEGSIEVVVMLHYFSKFLCRKATPVSYLIFHVLGIVSMILLPGNPIAQFSVFAFILILEGICIYKASYDIVLLYTVITIIIMRLSYGISDSLSCILFPLFLWHHPKMASILLMILGNITALLLSVLCYRIIYKNFTGDETTNVLHTFMVLMPTLFIFFVSEYISSTVYGSSVSIKSNGSIVSDIGHFRIFFIQLLGIISLFCVMYAYRKLFDHFSLNMRLSLLEQETNSLQQYVAEAQTRYEKTISFRHDMKNHMEIVRELLENNQQEQALAYLGEMKHLTADMLFPCNTNNPVLNILLANKLGIAKNHGVAVSCSLHVPYPCQIRDIDFCIVLSNALDNAIHATEKIRDNMEPYIQVTSDLQGDFLLMEIKNNIQGHTALKEGTGLKNIRAVAEKYHGAMDIQIQGNVFTLSVLLVIPQQTENIPQQTD